MAAQSDQEFYEAILAQGYLPPKRDVPERLLTTMATMIGRTAAQYFPPTECAELVALVVLGLRNAGWTVSRPVASPRSSPKLKGRPCKRNKHIGRRA